MRTLTWTLAPLVTFAIFSSPVTVRAQIAPEAAPPPEGRPGLVRDRSKEEFSLGFDLVRLQDDFGVGGTVSTPIFARWIRLTLSGGVAWYPYGHDASTGNTTWDPIGHGRLVVEVGPTFVNGNAVRPY